MIRGPNRDKSAAPSYIEVRLLATFALAVSVFTLGLPIALRAIDTNGDNLDDAWEAKYGITTTAYASSNLVGWWQMEGPTNVVDRSSHQLDGDIVEPSPTAFVPGLFGNALAFGPLTRVEIPAKSVLDTPKGLTFSTWFKSDPGAKDKATIATWTDARTNSWSVGIATNGVAEIRFTTAGSTPQIAGPSINTATLYDGDWHHLAATWLPEQGARIYVDGENQASEVIHDWKPSEVASFSLGTFPAGTTNQTFILDEARLYSRALGPDEITQLPATYTDLNGNGFSVWEDAQRGLDPVAPYLEKIAPPVNYLALWKGLPGNSEFTPWMTDPELHKFMLQFDTTPPGHHPNYWDKGHWINAVEGRWHDGVVQFRITYGPVPRHKGLWWYWYLGIGEKQFNRLAKQKAAEGYTLLDANSFVRPDGFRSYQGVWHKVTQWEKPHPSTNLAPDKATP